MIAPAFSALCPQPPAPVPHRRRSRRAPLLLQRQERGLLGLPWELLSLVAGFLTVCHLPPAALTCRWLRRVVSTQLRRRRKLALCCRCLYRLPACCAPEAVSIRLTDSPGHATEGPPVGGSSALTNRRLSVGRLGGLRKLVLHGQGRLPDVRLSNLRVLRLRENSTHARPHVPIEVLNVLCPRLEHLECGALSFASHVQVGRDVQVPIVKMTMLSRVELSRGLGIGPAGSLAPKEAVCQCFRVILPALRCLVVLHESWPRKPLSPEPQTWIPADPRDGALLSPLVRVLIMPEPAAKKVS